MVIGVRIIDRGLRDALSRWMIATRPKSSRVAPYLCRYCCACTANCCGGVA
jgi:hypothetical protein